ncbi:MAG TPA: hypothetical protein VHA82_17345 [Ramlibacter sp.]|nr:hypothetical protein [Ramlibacter sp.]
MKRASSPVQHGHHRRAHGPRGFAHILHGIGEMGDVARVFFVLVRDLLAGARGPRLDRRMHVLVLVLQVRSAEVQQLEHALGDLREFQIVVAIHAADGQERIGHQRAQRLVDAGIYIEARRGGLADAGEFLGVDVHHGFLSRRTAV